MLKLIILFAFNLFEANNEDGKCKSGVENAEFCVLCVLSVYMRTKSRTQRGDKKGEWNRKPGDTQRSLWFKKLLGILTHTHTHKYYVNKEDGEREREWVDSSDSYTSLATASKLSPFFIYVKRVRAICAHNAQPKNLTNKIVSSQKHIASSLRELVLVFPIRLIYSLAIVSTFSNEIQFFVLWVLGVHVREQTNTHTYTYMCVRCAHISENGLPSSTRLLSLLHFSAVVDVGVSKILSQVDLLSLFNDFVVCLSLFHHSLHTTLASPRLFKSPICSFLCTCVYRVEVLCVLANVL